MNTTHEIIAAWRRAICSPDGPESPFTRYLLLALGVRMEQDKLCDPSASRIAEDARLSKRAVIAHLQAAEEGGWIARRRIRRKGRLWHGITYEPRFPVRFDGNQRGGEVQEMHRVVQGVRSEQAEVVP